MSDCLAPMVFHKYHFALTENVDKARNQKTLGSGRVGLKVKAQTFFWSCTHDLLRKCLLRSNLAWKLPAR